MNARLRQLAMRREHLVATIASQRVELEACVQQIRGPMAKVDRLREALSHLRDRLPLIIVGLSALMLAARSRVLAKKAPERVSSVAKWGRRASRWWALWRVVAAIIPRLRKL